MRRTWKTGPQDDPPECRKGVLMHRSSHVVVLSVGRLGATACEPVGESQGAGTGCVGRGLSAAESHLRGLEEGKSKSSRKRLRS